MAVVVGGVLFAKVRHPLVKHSARWLVSRIDELYKLGVQITETFLRRRRLSAKLTAYHPSKILMYTGIMGVKTVVTVLAQGNHVLHVIDAL